MQLAPHRWRDDLIMVILKVIVIFGAIVAVPSIYLAIATGLYGVAIADGLALVGIVALRYSKRLSLASRALGLGAVLYLLGLMLTLVIGTIGHIYLIGFSLITTFLLGQRAGFATAALNALSLCVIGLAGELTPGSAPPSFISDESGSVAWFVVVLNFALVNVALVTTISSVLATLEIGMEREANARLSLQRSQALLRMSLRVGRFGAWDIQLPGRVFTWASVLRGRDTFDGSRLESIDAAFGACVPQDAERFVAAFERCATRGEPFDVEVRLKGISHSWLRWMGEARRNESGTIVGVQGAQQDITEQKEAERTLRASERRLAEQAELLEKAQDAIVVRDLDGRVTYLNRRAEELFGWSREVALEADVRTLQYQDSDESHKRAMQTTLASGAWTGELKLTPKDGQQVIVESRWTLLNREDGEPYGVMSIDTDITDKKRLEEQLLRAQRLESIGTLAGGIAHDLNNVITPIMMASEMLRLSETDADRIGDINTIEVCARRASDLVRQIVGFARGFDGKRIEVDVSGVLIDLEHMVRETFPKNLQVAINCAPDVDPILGDATQLSQVLMNLCVNARDAMNAGGALTVSAKNEVLDADYVRKNCDAKPGAYVVFQVVDTGMGMDPATLERIFEPFFTTKEVGKGTGLGLFTTHAIVKAHAGFITVYSEPGRGTAFHIHLPAVASSGTPSVASAKAQPPRGRGECILVVDDEDRVRSTVCRTLERHGYRSFVARNGAEAMAVFAQNRESIDLVLTDVSMPVMDGSRLTASLRFIAPDIKVIGSSGLTKPVIEDTGAQFDEFLSKPYTADALLTAVRTLLDRKVAP